MALDNNYDEYSSIGAAKTYIRKNIRLSAT